MEKFVKKKQNETNYLEFLTVLFLRFISNACQTQRERRQFRSYFFNYPLKKSSQKSRYHQNGRCFFFLFFPKLKQNIATHCFIFAEKKKNQGIIRFKLNFQHYLFFFVFHALLSISRVLFLGSVVPCVRQIFLVI